MRVVKHRFLVFQFVFLVGLVLMAQEVEFPYPAIPDEVEEPEARLSYMLDHFWQHYTFADPTEANQRVGEQGLVDFCSLMQQADSLTAARAAQVLADSLRAYPVARSFFEEQMERYLADPESPLCNDEVYAHLLRAWPQTAQRRWLVGQLVKNRVGTVATDILVMLNDERRCRLCEVEAPLTLIVFFDPDCERCHWLEVQMAEEPLIGQNPRVCVVRKRVDELHGEYFVPHTPSLYLLDAEKRVVLKGVSLPAVLQALQP